MGKDYEKFLNDLKRVDPSHPFLQDYQDVQGKFDLAMETMAQ